MKQNNYIYIACLLISLSFIMSSCTERIDLDLKDIEPRISIYGCITDTFGFQSVTVTKTTPYFIEETNPRISDAKVSITSSNNETWLMHESKDTKGLYQTAYPVAGTAGTAYHLRVEYDFDEDGIDELYESTATLYSRLAIDSIGVKKGVLLGKTLYYIGLYAQDDPKEDFYMSKYKVNGKSVTYLSRYALFSDRILNGQYLYNYVIRSFGDRNELHKYSISERDGTLFTKPGDTITVELNRISKGYFYFIDQCQLEKGGNNPFFGGPPANVSTNISNGAVGYFSAYSPAITDVIIPKEKELNE